MQEANQPLAVQSAVTPETVCADFGVRLVAYIIDAVIIAVPNFILQMILGPLLSLPISLVIGIGYAVYFWTSSGQTPGKMLMGLQVVSAQTGKLLQPGEAVVRYLGYIVSGIAIGLGFLWVIWDPMHEGWHDKIAKTKVIKVAK